MGIMGKIFGDEVVASARVRAEISAAEATLAELRGELAAVFTGIATMCDPEHEKAEERAACIKRAIARHEAKIGQLEVELPSILRAEEAAEKAASDLRLSKRAEAARKSVNVEARRLLAKYDQLAGSLAEVLLEVAAIEDEVIAVNQALTTNPVADTVASISDTHRKYPDRQASERREMRQVWVCLDPHTGEEHVSVATLNDKGQPTPTVPLSINEGVRRLIVQPRLEHREVVIERRAFRRGEYLVGLSEVRLPPGILGSEWHWPPKR